MEIGSGGQPMKNIILAGALMIAAPAMACKDWQAVARFDEMITKHHELLFSSLNCDGEEYLPNSKIVEMVKGGKKPPAKASMCSAYSDAVDADYNDMEEHRDAALKDECGNK
jgi:hypothetical protein